ncbi:26 kDa periplasmic immunogenic protein precursor [Kingella potus]|uniref:26 kDa periplasmic immunogenic protein n=1 Tax=Kingella potus TaxID=265175 RepID=A0A377R4E4_9NEIS|nr:SIMPL domain-containing protein [Kingella potus]STR03361.1 26 kDa periplasmic immunogenic protein precursor [Kingella potus]
MKAKRRTALLLAALAAAAQAEPLNYNVVEFAESATVAVPHDTMTAVFAVRSEAREREAAHRAFAAKQAAFVRRTRGQSAFKISESGRNVYPVYHYPGNRRVLSGWQESVEYTIESRDFAALGRLVEQSRQETEIQDTRFSLSMQKRHAAVDEAGRTALLRFKERAASLAQTLGFSGYKIVSLKLGELGDMPVAMPKAYAASARMAADSAPADIPPAPGVEDVRITVNGSVQMDGGQ